MSGASDYPANEWTTVDDPGRFGWSSTALANAYRYAQSIGSSAIMIVQDGLIMSSWGKIADVTGIASMRKSLLSALIGTHEIEGTIDLAMTLAELDIDDCEPALTPKEKQATIADLLMSRSGVYHAAADQDPALLPPRGIHAAGEQWFYNNWSFNVLGGILQQLSGVPIAEDFFRRIAIPLQMQDFRPEHFYFKTIPQSIHPAYKIRMSARDLARLGVLLANDGRWRDAQIIPAEWISRSIAPYTDLGRGAGFGYSWWIGRYTLQPLTAFDGEVVKDKPFYWASGMGNQYLMVFPDLATVLVHRVNDTNNGPSSAQIEQLQAMLLGSRVAGIPLTTPISK
ncbi:CubicO group peptidase (beta-lactamase class C family) [Rhizobium sp. ERR 922]|uniref:Amide hydrolase n=1 Tax=Rhizobium dioscoreae TaxID=2653122 RepID=A0ABQ0YZL4_9HYPH|nr:MULTISPECIES: serine hydrolase [Rhizobium]TWB61998.1 CubicO group peptidase (beta-lactamase class C family) [Rhizobium sp. ERR 922]TWC04924.1 CubicO group peptidase (beta-lactamase class C family) [Rhizobium sp. ERR 942]GES48642.1 amide hydrolase [Rhizobium dioscoreae]GLU78889.1 amide hydrolase [Rhizobium sp. NBRC 114257]